MSKDNELLIDPAFEEFNDDEQDFEIDAALNNLAMNTLNFMNEQVLADKTIPEDEYFFVMLHAAEAIMFNLLVEMEDKADLDALELAIKTKDNLIEAIKSLKGGCCGGDHHHHH